MDENNQPLLEMLNVSKRFGQTRAVDNVMLNIPAGKIVGLLGANAAGKTSLLRHTIGLYLPDSGECRSLGCPIAKLGTTELQQIGFVHQEDLLVEWLTGRQYLSFISAYYPKWNAELEQTLQSRFEVDLTKRIGKMSPGERQKLAIIAAVAYEPRLLIMDEPAASLDPLARATFLELLLEIIQDSNRSVLISSHILTDLEKVIDHVLIMKKGQLLVDATLDELRERYCKVHLTVVGNEPLALAQVDGVLQKKAAFKALYLVCEERALPALRSIAQQMDSPFECSPLSLEETFAVLA